MDEWEGALGTVDDRVVKQIEMGEDRFGVQRQHGESREDAIA